MAGSRSVISVAHIDPSPAAQARIAHLVERRPGFTLVDDPARADVVLVDPEGDGMVRCSLLAAGGSRVVLYAVAPDPGLRLGAEVAGARAVVDKAAHPDTLFAAIRDAAPRRVLAA